MKTFLLVGALLFSLSCDHPTAVVGGQLSVRVTPLVLHLTNQTSATVYFFAIEGGLAIRANWAPCTDPPRCRGIASGSSLALPFDEIAGYHAGAQTVIVYWWHLIPGDEVGFRPDSIRVTGVRL